MGRDEHKKRKNSRFAQTPSNQLNDGVMNVDYIEEFSDEGLETASEVNPGAQELNDAANVQQRKK